MPIWRRDITPDRRRVFPPSFVQNRAQARLYIDTRRAGGTSVLLNTSTSHRHGGGQRAAHRLGATRPRMLGSGAGQQCPPAQAGKGGGVGSGPGWVWPGPRGGPGRSWGKVRATRPKSSHLPNVNQSNNNNSNRTRTACLATGSNGPKVCVGRRHNTV